MTAQFIALVLYCISMVETGGRDPLKPGAHGEIGQYQMLPENAKQYGVVGYLRKCEAALIEAGKPVTPYNLAICWNAGPGAAKWEHVNAATRNYAQRVQNLYDDLGRQ